MRQSLFFFIFIVTVSTCWSQGGHYYIKESIDSLSHEHPSEFQKIEPSGVEYLITIKNQQQFDNLGDYISDAIKKGAINIVAHLKCGTYRFHEQQFLLDGVKFNGSITIKGEHAIITAYDQLMNRKAEPWSETCRADDLIQVVDTAQKTCFIPYVNTFDKRKRSSFSKVKITEWFWVSVYDVLNVNERGIYFYAPELTYETNYSRQGYNVNFDYIYCGSLPRFRLYDSRIELGASASCFIKIVNSELNSLCFEGLRFLGNKSGDNLIKMDNNSIRQISFRNCRFENIHSGVATFSQTNNVVFDNNNFYNIYGSGVRFINRSNNIRVVNNSFYKCGLDLGQTFCINCGEAEYYIANNVFQDFGYSAIGVGIWHGHKKTHSSKGIIEHNEFFFSDDYFKNAWKHLLMDSGAIYVWTKNDGTIIRFNYIHDYVGECDNRGIFCDDGASNVSIYSNIIINIPNSYSIDSRMVKDQNREVHNNSNNFIANNVVNARIRYMGYSGEQRNVVKGANLILQESEHKPIVNKYDYLGISENDIVINSCNFRKGKVVVDNSNAEFLQGFISDSFLNSLFKVRTK